MRWWQGLGLIDLVLSSRTSSGVDTAVDRVERKPFVIAEEAVMLRDPGPEPHETILQFFEYSHLRDDLQRVSKPFSELAHWVDTHLPSNAERSSCLRKLLEAKDAGVRAGMARPASSQAEVHGLVWRDPASHPSEEKTNG